MGRGNSWAQPCASEISVTNSQVAVRAAKLKRPRITELNCFAGLVRSKFSGQGYASLDTGTCRSGGVPPSVCSGAGWVLKNRLLGAVAGRHAVRSPRADRRRAGGRARDRASGLFVLHSCTIWTAMRRSHVSRLLRNFRRFGSRERTAHESLASLVTAVPALSRLARYAQSAHTPRGAPGHLTRNPFPWNSRNGPALRYSGSSYPRASGARLTTKLPCSDGTPRFNSHRNVARRFSSRE